MGKKMQDKYYSDPHWDDYHPKCSSSLFHIVKRHPLRHFMKRLAYRKGGGERSVAGGAVPARRGEALANKKKDLNHAETRNSHVEKVTPYSSAAKNSVRNHIKQLIKNKSKKSRHLRSSTCPHLSQSIYTTSTHDMKQSNIDPFSKTIVNDESTRTKRCVQCCVTHGDDYWEYNLIGKHQPIKRDFCAPEIKEEKQCMVESKLRHARKQTPGSSTHFGKHFVTTLDTINMNKELLLKLLQDPASPLVYHFHKQQVCSAKMTLTRSVSFPLPDSLSQRKGTEVIGNGSLPKGQGKLCYGNKAKESIQFESSKSFCEQAIPSGSVQDHNQNETKHIKNLRQKIEHATGESGKEKLRVTMDAVIHKLPQGHGISDDLKKEILKKFTDPNLTRESEYCSPSCNQSDPFAHFFPKRHKHSIRRIRSLQEPLESYFKLHENSFNSEARHLQSEQLKLRTEKAKSPPLTMQSPFKRILSLPDLPSFSFAYQNRDISDMSSLTKPIVTSGDGTMSAESVAYQEKMLDLKVHSKSQVQLDTPEENLIEDDLVSVGENDLVISNVVGSGSGSDCSTDINGKRSTIFDDFGHSSLENGGTFNGQDIGPIKEYKAVIASSDSKSEPVLIDKLENKAEQQKANMESLKVIETTKNAQKKESLTKQLNYETHQFHVDTKEKVEFNYVKYILEISGLIGNDCFSAWHSSDQPVDPLLYEEMEGDPDFCTNEVGQCNHHVLFDIINETLLEIYGRNNYYHPIKLSYLPLIHPMPVGYRILHEVWTRVSKSLFLRSKDGQAIDNHVSRDLAKHDGWVNHQFYAQYVGLELEDLIFHDLLEEIMRACL